MTRPLYFYTAERAAKDIVKALDIVGGKATLRAAARRIEPIVANVIATARHSEASSTVSLIEAAASAVEWRLRFHEKELAAKPRMPVHRSRIKAPVRGRRSK
jgi:hypothetical protein